MVIHFNTEKERLDFVKRKFTEIEPKVAKKKKTTKKKAEKVEEKVEEKAKDEVQTD